MTAEIAIMNKNAVALAADSAVTMSKEGGQKIFTSVNKLFMLSKYSPVGAMIYGEAELVGVPWETIVKIYRTRLGKERFRTLSEYANNLIDFLDSGSPLFDATLQERHVAANVSGYFIAIKNEIEDVLKTLLEEKGKFTEDQVKQITRDMIGKHFEQWETAQMLPSIPNTHIGEVAEKYGKIIDAARERTFENLPMTSASIEQLKKIAASLFSKDIFPLNISGIVIAGFGEEESFPSLRSFMIHGVAGNRLKYKEHGSANVGVDADATIIPFAQAEMVYTFMEGLNPDLRQHMEEDLSRFIDGYADKIARSIENLSEQKQGELAVKLRKLSKSLVKDYQERVKAYRDQYYVSPIMNVVAMLPKDELALMAETLVSLTSFKRRVSLEVETVAPPIDVALISKGDGFVWIKRKHYFPPELNPQFLAKYYREEDHHNGQETK